MAAPVRINLALQGGGAHGAFSWGVLDRLLADDGIEIAAISGTSAGAVNAVVLKAGMASGGRQGARDNLAWLWGELGAVEDPDLSRWIAALAPAAPMIATAMEYSPIWQGFDAMSRMLSPNVYGPILRNPLEKLLSRLDFEAARTGAGPEIFLGATNVRTGKGRVFAGAEVSLDAVLASACLPTLFQTVEIDDPATGKLEAYWDGGYTGNPPLHPLYAAHLPDDIVIVNINPILREELPRDSQQIANRINEIGFNSSLLRDLRAIHFVRRLIGGGTIGAGAMKDVLVHMISDDPLMRALNVATKSVPNPIVLSRLRQAGEAAADAFLSSHRGDLNHRPTVDLVEMFG